MHIMEEIFEIRNHLILISKSTQLISIRYS